MLYIFIIKYNARCEFFIDVLYQIEEISLFPSLLSAYTMKGNEILSNFFSVSIEMIMCFFLFFYLNDVLQ